MANYELIRNNHDGHFPTDTPDDEQRLLNFVHGIRKPKHAVKQELLSSKGGLLTYDVDNCPDIPPKGYPQEWPVLDIVHNWRPNNATTKWRPQIYQGLCRFDYATDAVKAQRYRIAELPFILRDDPKVLKVVERWNQPDYLSQILGTDKTYQTEYSETNSLMFFREHKNKKTPDGWTPPMSFVPITYDEWAEKASQPDEEMGPDKPHWYFRWNAKGGGGREGKSVLFQELPFFQPKENFYLVDPQETRGINCRFGMQGNTAAAHFDGSRNFVMLFGGERRYILSHPKSCPNLALYPKEHPSGRHSATDWSDPDLETFPEFARATANEVVLQAGDVLYLPTQWFHYIISLDLNWQCNARSGITSEYERFIRKCGF